MKTIVSVFLVLATASALDLRNLVHYKAKISDIYPEYTDETWAEILSQKPTEEQYDGYKPGTVPQPGNAGKSKPILSSRIVGGVIASPGQFPWQVFIIIDGAYACGGSLIAYEWVLTAAHCTEPFSTFKVYLGAFNLLINEKGRVEITTTDKIVHDHYNDTNYDNDIALLHLPSAAPNTSYISVIQLPSFSMVFQSFDNEITTTSGWGIYSDAVGVISPVLRYVNVSVISNSKCAIVFGSYITPEKICTSGYKRKGTCNGDSGGPLMYRESDGRFTEIGLTSFGTCNCEDDYPSAYTRVTSYLKWISTITGIKIRD